MRPWTADQIAQLFEMRNAGGEFRDIARELGRTEQAAQSKYSEIKRERRSGVKKTTAKPKGQPPQKRACLKCGGSFNSKGPGNRICNDCKGSPEWRSGIL